MEEKKSYSKNVKIEILSYPWSQDLIKILLYSFIRTNAKIKSDYFILKTTQKEFKDKIVCWIEDTYDVRVKVEETLRLLKIYIYDKEFVSKLLKQIGNLVISTTEEYGAYIAGVFLGKGWMNSPTSKFYHFELRVNDIEHSLDITEAFDAVGIKTITIYKENWYYTYIKKSSLISDVLNLMNATESSMFFENERIQRDVITTYTKMEALEPYNLSKTLKASKEQIKYLKELFESPKLQLISKQKIKLAELRISNPSVSLFDLMLMFNDRYNKNISKSTVNHWLKQMVIMMKE